MPDPPVVASRVRPAPDPPSVSPRRSTEQTPGPAPPAADAAGQAAPPRGESAPAAADDEQSRSPGPAPPPAGPAGQAAEPRGDAARAAADDEQSRYKGFWADVGENFPDLGRARSTAQYRYDERWLLRTYLPALAGRRLFKTDLWDEAKNTRILRWAAGEGARAFGVDISPAIVADARRGFAGEGLVLNGVRGDVRTLPFRDGSFDAIYSMGTVEHFDDTDGALREIFRVLRPGGTAIIGVPNRRDPFLRPLLVALLYRIGLYGYGFEKSYSRPVFRRMLERAGFAVTAETGILFVPGWLRMADLFCHTSRLAPLRWCARLTGLLCAPFDRASRRWPRLRRHGYLLATVAVRPEGDGAAAGRESAR